MKFTIYGKNGCDLCEKRLAAVKSYVEKFNSKCNVSYVSVDEPEGLTEFAMTDDAGEIPCVVYVGKNERKVWSGANEFPTAKEVSSLIGAKSDVVMIPAGEIKRYNSSEKGDVKNIIDANRIN